MAFPTINAFHTTVGASAGAALAVEEEEEEDLGWDAEASPSLLSNQVKCEGFLPSIVIISFRPNWKKGTGNEER